MAPHCSFTFGTIKLKIRPKTPLKRKRVTVKNSTQLGRWFPPLLWAAVIFTFSSLETIKVTELFFWDFLLKKSAHTFEYAVLFTLTFRATRRNWFLTYALCIIYATSDEFHQSFVAGRTASVFDLAFDLSGMNLASYIIWKFYPGHRGKQKK